MSAANWVSRVPSSSRRKTRTACLKQPSERVPDLVATRRRSACSRADTNNTVSSDTGSEAVYVTLTAAQDPWREVFREKSTSYRGSALFRCTTTASGVSTHDSTVDHPKRSSRY